MGWHNKSRVPAHNALGDQEGRLLEKGTGRLAGSLNNYQLRHHRLIQQINRLLEPFILHKCCISLLCGLDRSMAEQMLNICNGSAPAQQASGKCLPQIM